MQITYTLQKQRRKSIAVGVSDHGEVYVKAPEWMRKNEIDTFLLSKKGWISKRLSSVKENKQALNMLFCDGELLYLGGIAKVTPKAHARARMIGKLLIIDPKKPIEDQIYKVLKTEAKTLIADLVAELEPVMGVRVKSIRLKDNSTNWGSASSQKNLNFNWRIIMAPLEVVRYLVIHEMAHLRYMNHSQKYWDFVSCFDDEYELHDSWLKENGSVLRVV